MPTDFEKTIDAYKAAEKMLADGRARAIGVSNFNPQHLRQLLDRTDVVPAVNQVELHPYFTQPALREVHAELGIVTQAWSPIGGVLVYTPGSDEARGPLTDPVITDLAAKYGKTPAQVVLRWHIEHGFSAIPKSVKPHRIAENFDVFDFSLKAGCGDRRARHRCARRPRPRDSEPRDDPARRRQLLAGHRRPPVTGFHFEYHRAKRSRTTCRRCWADVPSFASP